MKKDKFEKTVLALLWTITILSIANFLGLNLATFIATHFYGTHFYGVLTLPSLLG